MSLFDMLKYPISEPPTEQELAILPNDLFNNWIEKTEWHIYNINKSHVDHMGHWYRKYYYDLGDGEKDMNRKEIKTLRKMIAEYQE